MVTLHTHDNMNYIYCTIPSKFSTSPTPPSLFGDETYKERLWEEGRVVKLDNVHFTSIWTVQSMLWVVKRDLNSNTLKLINQRYVVSLLKTYLNNSKKTEVLFRVSTT
jgi:hypothetical protein